MARGLGRWPGWALAAAACFSALAAQADVKLPKVFSDHMVLQRDTPITVWGWAAPGEKVTVRVASSSGKAEATATGEWRVSLPALKAGGPHTMTVAGANTLTLDDILVGEVWLCSGQSNMEMGIKMCRDAEQEVAAANYPRIRLLMVPNRWTPQPMTDQDGTWKVCTPTTVAEDGWGGFSAAGYYFGRELHKQLNIPIGLIDATWGGTVIQTWTPPVGFAQVPAIKADYDRVLLGDPTTPQHRDRLAIALKATEDWVTAARKCLKDGTLVPAMPAYPGELLPPDNVQASTALYNGMVNPIVPFAIRGAIWYQGESNLGEGKLYTERMKALVGGWRKIWNTPDMPFYYVQIAPYNYGNVPTVEAEFWEAQEAALAIPNTGMAVTNDIANLADIHPNNKQDVGKRLALWALAKTYGKKDLVFRGPTFKTLATEGANLRVTFDNVGTGLQSRDGKPISWFEIIDADEGGFVKATATIDGASVVLSAPGVKKPVAVRYAWHMLAEPNLQSKEGLPVGAFRAGDVPKRDLLAMNVPEAKGYALVYDLDLGKLDANIKYDVDNHTKLTGAFDRIGYFVELQRPDGSADYIWTSMDAFTKDAGKIGVPTVASNAVWQQNVTNLNVISNAKGVTNGAGMAGGNIEFWPNNYGTPNPTSVPNASGEAYDWGDEMGAPAEGYGSMQVHNHDAKQVLFAINNWRAGGSADLGIGNSPAKELDWTFSRNASSFIAKRLRVLVHYK